MGLNTIAVLWIAVFFSSSIALCFLGAINDIAKEFSISLSLSGQTSTVYGLSFAILGPVLINLFANTSYKKSILSSAIMLFFLNLLVSYTNDIKTFFILRVIIAGLAAFLITKCFGYITEFSSKEKVGKNLSILYTSFPAANTFLIPLYSYISDIFGWREISQILAVSFIAIIIFSMCYIKLDRNIIMYRVDSYKTDFYKVKWYKNIRVVILLCTTICILGSNMILMGYIEPFLIHSGNHSVSIVLFIFGVGGVLGSYISSKVSDRYSESKGLKIVTYTYILLLPIIYIFQNTYLLSIVIFLWSVAQWASGPMIQKMLVGNARNNIESEILLSLNMSLINWGISLGGIIGGVAIKYSISQLPLVAMGVAVLPIIMEKLIKEPK